MLAPQSQATPSQRRKIFDLYYGVYS